MLTRPNCFWQKYKRGSKCSLRKGHKIILVMMVISDFLHVKPEILSTYGSDRKGKKERYEGVRLDGSSL